MGNVPRAGPTTHGLDLNGMQVLCTLWQGACQRVAKRESPVKSIVFAKSLRNLWTHETTSYRNFCRQWHILQRWVSPNGYIFLGRPETLWPIAARSRNTFECLGDADFVLNPLKRIGGGNCS